MTIGSLSGVGGLIQSQGINNANAKLQAAIANIVGGQVNDVTEVSTATKLQSLTAGLKQISANLAQGSSIAEVADGGAEQIQAALGKLRTLAQQAKSPTLNASNRADLNQQFQGVIKIIDQLAGGTSFNGQKLLNGSLSGDNALSLDGFLGNSSSANDTLAISSLSSHDLLPSGINLDTLDGIDSTITALENASNTLTGTRTSIGSFQQTLDFATANVDSALINQQAAQATLSDTDFAATSTNNASALFQNNAAIALAAQGNKLTSAVLQLIG